MTKPSLSGRTRPIVLWISLALNLLLISAIATYAWRGGPDTDRNRARGGIERLAARLPDADAAKLRAAYAAHAGALSTMRAESRHRRDAAREALRAEPFDRAGFEKALAGLAEQRAAATRAFGAIIAAAASQMSPEGRAALARRHRDR